MSTEPRTVVALKPDAQNQPYEIEVQEGKTYFWCACGQSKKQPFCDGSHQGTAFQPVRFKAEQSGTVWLCGCRESGNKPFCDGSHAKAAPAPEPPAQQAQTTPVASQNAPYEARVEAGRAYYWCACGRSSNQPFCDGSHQGTGITPQKFRAETEGSVWLCGCRRTGNAPYCDGSHTQAGETAAGLRRAAAPAEAAGVATIPPPEPDLTPAAMVQRARDLVPTLRARAQETERLRTLPEATVRAFLDAGFYRILQPRRFGGYELDLATFCEAMIEVTRGCGSSGWVLCLTAAHPYHLAAFPEEGQIEMYGSDGDFRAPMIFAPQGKATPVQGGYRLSGRWDYNSGGEHANWLGLTCIVPGAAPGSEPADVLMAFIPREDYSINDNWFVMGMRGTGSKQAVVEDVFVPQRRAISRTRWLAGEAPGYGLYENPFYRTPDMPVFVSELGSIAVGLAESALDAFRDRAMNKRSPFPPFGLLKEDPNAQSRMGRARVKADAARALLFRIVADQQGRCERIARGDYSFSDEEIRRAILQSQEVLALARESVDTLFAASGSSAGKTGQLMERVFRDINMMRTHFLMNMDRTAENWGALHFGLEPKSAG